MAYEYIVAGISIINDILYLDGSRKDNRLGGCAIFAYGGIGLYTDSILFLSSGGDDFFDAYGAYFEENGISKEGIYLTMPHTHHTLLKYEKDGTWNETSIHGEDYFALQNENCRTSLEKLKPFLNKETKGLYLDSAAGEKIFEEIEEIRRLAPAMKIMWEPPTFSSKDPSKHEIVLNDLKKVDFYSMNLDEASAFFGASSRDEAVAEIMDLNIPCFLREGENGSSWIEEGKIVSLRACDPEKAVDVTGCGNCSTAAALYAVCEGKHPEDIVLYANIAAGLCARHEGPAPIRKARQERAYEQLKEFYAK